MSLPMIVVTFLLVLAACVTIFFADGLLRISPPPLAKPIILAAGVLASIALLATILIAILIFKNFGFGLGFFLFSLIVSATLAELFDF